MKIRKVTFALVFGLFLSSLSLSIVAQDAGLNIALQRGYRTGYSDGYMAGYRDVIDNQTKSFDRQGEYSKGDRAYSKDYGTVEDYRDGYQQGFETGYATGFEKRSFEASLPTSLKKRGAVTTETQSTTDLATDETPVQSAPDNTSARVPAADSASVPVAQRTYVPTNDAIVLIPKETELMLELNEDLSTERNREGDKFAARVVGPSEIAGAMVEGRVSKITKPGRLKRRSEMTLTFDRIVLSDERWTNFSGILIEVVPVKGDNVKRVDNERTAVGKSSLKGDASKIGGATGAGLVVGAIAGGPVGAAVGASVGAAFGVGAVVIERGKHVSLNKNQQIRIKTSYESQIR